MITRPYGSWPSPLSAQDAAVGGTRFSGLVVEPGPDGRLWWAESRPAEGRTAIVAGGRSGIADVGGSWLRARSRVNEYGGGAFWLGPRRLYWVDERSQCLMSLDRGELVGPTTQVTDEIIGGPPHRLAAGAVTPDERWIVCERERHLDQAGSTSVLNELVAIEVATGAEHLVVGASGPGAGDFVAAPTLSPDGSLLAWLRWDHPDMPWDAAELWAGRLDVADGAPRVNESRRVAGGPDHPDSRVDGRAVSVALPKWSPDGVLWWCDDSTDWWHLHRALQSGCPQEGSGDLVDALLGEVAEEVGEPRWVAGGTRYGLTGDGRLVYAAAAEGVDSIWVVDLASGQREPLPGGFTSVEYLAVAGDHVGVIGGSSGSPTSVWSVDLSDGSVVDLRRVPPPLAPEWVSHPIAVTFPTGDGDQRRGGDAAAQAHALFYPPTSGDHVAPDGELPPLLVRIHGGPTAAARSEFSTSVQFWTTRGFAVADVNYRGSTGYGRRFRDLLRGRWGDADVEDCIAVTEHLAAAGLVDPARCVIRGGSSGGLTALATLCSQAERGAPGAFAAACSLYGVTDMAALASDTHKFEARYLDGLVGQLPDDLEVYRSRSPLFHADQLDRPVLLLQGSDDRVVPPSQAEVLVEALVANGVPHAYVLFEGEGHGFHKADTVVRALETELAFYGAVLGFEPDGLAEPFSFE